ASHHIESHTKTYGVSILICDTTRDLVKDVFHLREIDVVAPFPSEKGNNGEGKAKPVAVYEVVGRIEEELGQNLMTALICYEMGLSEYRAQNWAAALSHFRKGVQLVDDPPSKTFVERCRAIGEGVVVVPEGWDGVWVFGD
ncbi:hypothetical protein HK104_002694, partial [Borealophlyctis nickersoniae]